MKEFNWVGFKKGEFHVYCETQEDSKDFLQKCERRGSRMVRRSDVKPLADI